MPEHLFTGNLIRHFVIIVDEIATGPNNDKKLKGIKG